ncbi:MAG: hypothetical protein GTN80_03505 [Nitrososphaeria archaeon]|nr:hypothetical protein [Nitrososphaeria archaeon]NIN52242.1 hypothetical protein [Nitrososphaeria archaeon]NIQ32698.1 hypothetical protein [Nitrososphaeria archaeon]
MRTRSLPAIAVLSAAVVGLLFVIFIAEYSGQTDLEKRMNVSIERGLVFLNDNLWAEKVGAYRVTPDEEIFFGDDNYLAYVFHTEYPVFRNGTRADMILSFLRSKPLNLDLGRRRWVVLSSNYTDYKAYEEVGWADKAILDGIYYAKFKDIAKAWDHFRNVASDMYDPEIGLIEDVETDKLGNEYYKTALALILAAELDEEVYIRRFSHKLMELQREDGSWLTDNRDPSTTYPNTETSLVILMALSQAG